MAVTTIRKSTNKSELPSKFLGEAMQKTQTQMNTKS